MADNSASASHRRYPPKKRARTDSDLEELSPIGDEDSGSTDSEGEEDSSPSPSTDQESPSTSKDHYLSLLAKRNRLTNEPLISTSDRDDLLAFAAACYPDTIGHFLQGKYDLAKRTFDLAKARQELNIRISDNFDSYIEEVKILLSSIPPGLDPSESRTRMRQLYSRVDQIFDLILRVIDLDSQVERKGSAARAMQKIIRHLLIFSAANGYTIPEEFRSGPGGRLGLDGKMLKLIKDKFDHKRHNIKMMMVCEDSMGGSDWVQRVEELVRLSSRAGEVFKKLRQVLNMVKADAYDPATDYDSCGMATF